MTPYYAAAKVVTMEQTMNMRSAVVATIVREGDEWGEASNTGIGFGPIGRVFGFILLNV